MRLFAFPLLLLSLSAYAQLDTGTGADGACNGTTPSFANGGTFNCTTLNLSSISFNAGASPLIIKVQGNANISGNINLSGVNGISNDLYSGPAGGNPGGQGGPGAGNGGGDNASTPQDASDVSASSGHRATGGKVACEDGGGGGGMKNAGSIGTFCGTGADHPGPRW